MPLPLLPLAGAATSLLGGIFGNRGAKKKAEEERRARVAGMQLEHNMGEDRRLGRLDLAQSILGGLRPGAAYGGRVNFNTAINPEVLARLQQRRQYNFNDAVADPNAGSGSSFLGGLLGGLGGLLGETDLARQQRQRSSRIQGIPVDR